MAIIWTEKLPKRVATHRVKYDVRISSDNSNRVCVYFYGWAKDKYNNKYLRIGCDSEHPNRAYFLATDSDESGYKVSTRQAGRTGANARLPRKALSKVFGNGITVDELLGAYSLQADYEHRLDYIEINR